jgi:cobaltochelatase CobT
MSASAEPRLASGAPAGTGGTASANVPPGGVPKAEAQVMRKESPADVYRQVATATVRSMAAKGGDIEVNFGGEAAAISGNRVRLPMLPRELDPGSLASMRGAADQVSLRLRHHDATLHAGRLPINETARATYDALEQCRCETVGAQDMAGVTRNLDAALADRYRRKGFERIQERDQVPLADAVRLIAREAMTGQPIPKSAASAVGLWREWVEQRIGSELPHLREVMEDQDSFSRLSRKLLARLDLEDDPFENEEQEEEQEEENQDSADQEKPDSQNSPGEGEPAAGQPQMDFESSEGDMDQSGEMEGEDMEGDERQGAEGDEPAGPGQPWMPPGERGFDPEDYRPFTTRFDEVVIAEDLCDPEELTRLRLQLDQQLKHLQGVIARLANRLQRRLMAQQLRAWDFNLEEGLLDTARLDRIITNPALPLTYKMETDTDFRDTAVSLLIDNSGSMRGRPITIAAIAADILARTLERCGVKVEILGFTTRQWKGGESRNAWIEAGKPASPGRLNDLRHIIYKPADAPWRRARKSLGLMLREGLLKENIDGEALLWAHQRLIARPEDRRILMVISDGAPVDDSTLSVNSGSYLERHLRNVIDYIETRSPVQLVAIGIGHDVTRYYKRAVTIVDAEQLGGTMMNQLASLFEEETGGPRRRNAA